MKTVETYEVVFPMIAGIYRKAAEDVSTKIEVEVITQLSPDRVGVYTKVPENLQEDFRDARNNITSKIYPTKTIFKPFLLLRAKRLRRNLLTKGMELNQDWNSIP